MNESVSKGSRRRRWVLLILGLGALAATWIFWPAGAEPKYRGKALGEWLAISEKRFTGELTLKEIDAAPEAVRHIGTNAIPWLLKWITDSTNTTKLDFLIDKLPEWTPNFVRSIGRMRREQRAQAAVSGFQLLGPVAKPAIPQLIDLAIGGVPYAQQALQQFGDDAMQALLARLADTNDLKRAEVTHCIREWSGNLAGRAAVPILIDCLNDPSPTVAEEAVWALATFATGDKQATCSLIQTLEHTNATVRRAAAKVIAQWGEEQARPAMTVLLRQLRSPPLAREAALALGQLRVQPKVVVPALARALSNPDPEARLAIIRTLQCFDYQAPEAIPALLEACSDTDPDVRRAAFATMSRLDEKLSEAIPGVTAEERKFRLRYGLPPR